MYDGIKYSKNINPYIIDVTHTTAHTLFWPPGMSYHKRKVRFYEIEFIIGGAGQMITDDICYKTIRGDIFFRNPGCYTQGVAGYYSYVIAFDTVYTELHKKSYMTKIPYWLYDESSALTDDGFFNDYPKKYNTMKFKELDRLFFNIINSFQVSKENNQSYMKANLISIIDIIKSELNNNIHKNEKKTIRNNYNKIITCKDYIDKNLGNKFTLDILAEKCGLSPNFFCKIFKEIIGITPIDYIIENRMMLSKKLLITTNISVDQISSICGFEDRTYFYRLFKKFFNTTPAQFRANYKCHTSI